MRASPIWDRHPTRPLTYRLRGRERGNTVAGGVSQRLEAIVESATLAITARAKELSARGVKVVDFGVGEPDFPTPAHIVEAAAAATREYRYHRYTATAGLPELRRAVAERTRRDSGYAVDAGQVLIT